MIGDTSRDAEEVVVAVVEGCCDMVVVEDGVATGAEEVVSDCVEEEVLLLASGFRETPRSCWISSELSPLDSRKATLRSVGESRIDSSSRNLEA